MTDTIPLWFAIPATITLLVAWRRQVIRGRRRARQVENHHDR